MERLPEMFGVLRPGNRYQYVSLCKNTIEKRKQRQYHDAPLHQPRRYSYVDGYCNILEFVPMHGRYYSLVQDDHADSLHELQESMVGWKNSSFQRRKRQYCVLPFVLCYNSETYPVISFNCTSWLSSQDGSARKILLTDEDDHSISLAHRMLGLTWGCGQYDRSEPAEIDHDAGEALQEALQDDKKEPEPIPNKLPTFVIENHMHCEIFRSECPIASIGLNECDRVSMLDCYHVFDSESIHAWMRIKAECPVCKGNSKIIHTLSVPESLRPPAPAPMIEPAPPAPKKLPKPGIAPPAAK